MLFNNRPTPESQRFSASDLGVVRLTYICNCRCITYPTTALTILCRCLPFPPRFHEHRTRVATSRYIPLSAETFHHRYCTGIITYNCHLDILLLWHPQHRLTVGSSHKIAHMRPGKENDGIGLTRLMDMVGHGSLRNQVRLLISPSLFVSQGNFRLDKTMTMCHSLKGSFDITIPVKRSCQPCSAPHPYEEIRQLPQALLHAATRSPSRSFALDTQVSRPALSAANTSQDILPGLPILASIQRKCVQWPAAIRTPGTVRVYSANALGGCTQRAYTSA